jgi:hypothetical protein
MTFVGLSINSMPPVFLESADELDSHMTLPCDLFFLVIHEFEYGLELKLYHFP